MSTAFTIADKYIQRHASLEEIRTAYNQRRAALQQAERTWNGTAWSDGSTAIAAGTKIQAHGFFTEIQGWIENNCGEFMPPNITDYNNTDKSDFKTIGELAGVGSAWTYFCSNISGWTGYSDLSSGWRRSTTIGTITDNGQVQSGDYIRWTNGSTYFDLWQDIRAALSALKITTLHGSYDSGLETFGDLVEKTDGSLTKIGTATYYESDAESDYDADAGEATSHAPFAMSLYEYSSPNSYFLLGGKTTIKYYIPDSTLFDTVNIGSVKVFLETATPTAMEDYVPSSYPYPSDFSPGSGYTYNAHGTGLIQDKLALISSPTPTGLGDNELENVAAVAGADFVWTSYGYGHGFEATSDPWRGIIVWNFTNSDY